MTRKLITSSKLEKNVKFKVHDIILLVFYNRENTFNVIRKYNYIFNVT